MTQELHIDGAQGEGGGQIIRSSLALSLVTGRSFRIENIRAGREKPGLRRQHLAAVRAAAEICKGRVTGAEVGSTTLAFDPQPVCPGSYRFAVGTAGSATLVLQTVLPACLLTKGAFEMVFEGGTANQWAPPFDFLQRAYLPLVTRMGPFVEAHLERQGFYPAGGGRFSMIVDSSGTLSGFDLLERGTLLSRSVRGLVANLPLHIAEREVRTALDRLGWNDVYGVAEKTAAHGAGNIVFIELQYEHVTEVFTGFGRLGVRAEQVAEEAAAEATAYLATDAPVGPHLADQLLLPLGLSAWLAHRSGSAGGGAFRTLPLTLHSTTHMNILKAFLDIDIRVEDADTGTPTIRIGDVDRDSCVDSDKS
jgi:RNA 3'-terminal phosphate cyclase (ATP)